MSSTPLTMCPPQRLYEKSGLLPKDTEPIGYTSESTAYTAVVAEESSAVFNPKRMNIGQYYLAVVDKAPYIYRKINDKEVEVYGMARKD